MLHFVHEFREISLAEFSEMARELRAEVNPVGLRGFAARVAEVAFRAVDWELAHDRKPDHKLMKAIQKDVRDMLDTSTKDALGYGMRLTIAPTAGRDGILTLCSTEQDALWQIYRDWASRHGAIEHDSTPEAEFEAMSFSVQMPSRSDCLGTAVFALVNDYAPEFSARLLQLASRLSIERKLGERYENCHKLKSEIDRDARRYLMAISNEEARSEREAQMESLAALLPERVDFVGLVTDGD